jgi:hypothetical protein
VPQVVVAPSTASGPPPPWCFGGPIDSSRFEHMSRLPSVCIHLSSCHHRCLPPRVPASRAAQQECVLCVSWVAHSYSTMPLASRQPEMAQRSMQLSGGTTFASNSALIVPYPPKTHVPCCCVHIVYISYHSNMGFSRTQICDISMGLSEK